MGIAVFHAWKRSRRLSCADLQAAQRPVLNSLHVRREVCRHKAVGMELSEAIGWTQWLLTSEEHTPFHWLTLVFRHFQEVRELLKK